MHFGDELITRVRALGHPLCVGLDPHLDRIPERFHPKGGLFASREETALAVRSFCLAIVERVAGRVAIVKPQIAFFEQLGWQGLKALQHIVAEARKAGLLVLLDAKRGDIGSTAAGYAAAYLGPEAPIEVDAITLNPYLGLDTLEPFAKVAQAQGRGLFVLVKTSNPGSGDLQDIEAGMAPVYARVAASLAQLSERLEGPKTGWSSLGVVVGATYPAEQDAVRSQLAKSLFLVPGYGAQGGKAADAVRSFMRGPEKVREGGIVSSSRAVLFPEAAVGAGDNKTWAQAIDNALSHAIDELSKAVS